jgi:hypothetical protein
MDKTINTYKKDIILKIISNIMSDFCRSVLTYVVYICVFFFYSPGWMDSSELQIQSLPSVGLIIIFITCFDV